VTTTADSGAGSLREAVAQAAPAGTICFDPTVFHRNAPEPDRTIVLASEVVVDKDLFVNGPGTDAVTITRGESFTRLWRVVEGVSVTLEGLTVKGGYLVGGSGGGILNGGTLTVENSLLQNHHAYYGGAIYSFGPLTITNSTITESQAVDGGGMFVNFARLSLADRSRVMGNDAGQRGGGVFYRGNDLILQGEVRSNTATEGGGLYLVRGNSPYTYIDGRIDGAFYDNSAARGGGVYFSGSNRSSPELFFYGTVSGNTATERGGGMYKDDGSLILWDSRVLGNQATWGDGIYNQWGSLTLQGDSRVHSNTAEDQGGGMYLDEDVGTYTGSTRIYDVSSVLSNSAGQSGGGIYNARSTLIVEYNSRAAGWPAAISSNLAPYGGGVYNLGNVVIRTGNEIRLNGATVDGGGVYNLGEVTLEFGSIIDNTANDYGGGVYNLGGTLTLQNTSRVTENRANYDGDSSGTGGGIYNNQGTLNNALAGGNVSNNTPNDLN
jgi:hypothetical protein